MAQDASGLAFTNAGGSILDAGRRINRSGIGLSSSSRQGLETFFSGATGLFNQLYSATVNQASNNATQILALRSQYSAHLSDAVAAPASDNSDFQPPQFSIDNLDANTRSQILALRSKVTGSAGATPDTASLSSLGIDADTQKEILALRAKAVPEKVVLADHSANATVPSSDTTGTNVDTTA